MLAILSLLLPVHAFSQTNNATLGGTVSDSMSALIPGVTITATNTQTGIVTTVVSNETGAYQFAALQPGTYKVSAELPGFQTMTYDQVILGVSAQVRLNFTLQVGGVAQAVEVTIAADTLIATTSASVGTVLPEQRVRDLPLAGRDVLDLLATTAGTRTVGGAAGSFAGGRVSAVNVTRDGINVQDGRYQETGAFSTTFVSPDLVEEVRVIVAPADAETGRGSGQVQLLTRSGTNQYRGSVFWTNRNSVLNANSWFNNFNGVSKNYENRNQFGARVAGPIIRNKTFFFYLFEAQRYLLKQSAVGPVLTEQARQGIFRFFPGAQNQNAAANVPTVDFQGNPVRPPAATGDLQSFNVFGRDPLRPALDPSGYIQSVLAKMPPPNDFTTGDGLNTAGHRWLRRIDGTANTNGSGPNTNRNTHNFRLDHNFNPSHKVFFSGTIEKSWAVTTTAGIPTWPGGYFGQVRQKPRVFTASLVSTLSPSIVNEARVGYRTSQFWGWAPFDRPDEVGAEAFEFLPQNNGIPYTPKTILFPEHFIANTFASTRAAASPLNTYIDTLSWNRGQHAFKGGVEIRFTSSNGWNSEDIVPRVFTGAGAFPVRGIDNTTIAGLVAQNQTLAQNLLLDLAGSVGSIRQGFSISGSKDPVFLDYRDLKQKRRDIHQNEWMVFFKDDWKVRPNLTLNLGLRYEFYGVPWESSGLVAAPIGGSGGLFGISGNSWDALWQPGLMGGSLTAIQFVGKNSPNPDQKLHKDDWNNFGPAVGLSWQIPWFGRDKTVLRAGYGINYSGAARFNQLDATVATAPGMNLFPQPVPSTYTNLTGVVLPVAKTAPLQPIQLTDRTQDIFLMDDNFVRPYIQNYNVELQRELVRNLTLELRYVGSKGTKLYAGMPLNEVNIFENGILEAFNITRAGGNAPLFDRMLMGLNIAGFGTVNGTTLTGSAALRQNTGTRAFIANGNVGQFANYLNTNPFATGVAGGLLSNGGLPPNYIVVNPQFLNVEMISNPGSSTYHSGQIQVTKRLSHGFSNQTSYTWSRSLGETDTDGSRFGNIRYRDPRNRSEQKTLIGHRTHDIRSNGTFELPFGPNRALLGGSTGILARLVERWQLGGILSWSSGSPLTLVSGRSTLTAATAITPDIVGDFPKSIGEVTRVSNGVIYFPGLAQIADPDRAGVTALQATQGSHNGMAIVDSEGRLILVNAPPGRLGSLGQNWIEGPSTLGLDVNLVKRVKIAETKEFELRVDGINILNRPNFGSPNLNINSTTFGRITGASGTREFVVNARLNF
jgi:hypothetical protein